MIPDQAGDLARGVAETLFHRGRPEVAEAVEDAELDQGEVQVQPPLVARPQGPRGDALGRPAPVVKVAGDDAEGVLEFSVQDRVVEEALGLLADVGWLVDVLGDGREIERDVVAGLHAAWHGPGDLGPGAEAGSPKPAKSSFSRAGPLRSVSAGRHRLVRSDSCAWRRSSRNSRFAASSSPHSPSRARTGRRCRPGAGRSSAPPPAASPEGDDLLRRGGPFHQEVEVPQVRVQRLARHLDLLQPVGQAPEPLDGGPRHTPGRAGRRRRSSSALATQLAELDLRNELEGGGGHDRLVG